MKINGATIKAVNEVPIPIIRGGEPTIYFVARAVTDDSEFYKLVPEPQPPMALTAEAAKRGETKMVPDATDKGYVKALGDWKVLRFYWIMLKSLEATPGIEWETVKMNDPGTWANWQTELAASGLSQAEIGYVRDGIMEANSLNEDKLEAARKLFFQGRASRPSA